MKAWVVLLAVSLSPLNSVKAQTKGDSQPLSLFPLGGRQGSKLAVKIRGQNLKGAYGVWFDCEAVKAEITNVQEIDSEDAGKRDSSQGATQPKYQVTLDVTVAPTALTGAHTLRLISPQGISEPQLFQVNSEPVVIETEALHDPPDQTQHLSPPVVVSGQISQGGEVDYYSLEVQKGQKLLFEAGSGSGGFEPILNLYEPSGSWFDPHRLREIGLDSEPNSPVMVAPRRVYGFEKSGRYVVAIGAFLGFAKPRASYQLRIVGAENADSWGNQKPFTLALAHSEPSSWRERDFARRIEADRLQALWSRSVRAPRKAAVLVATEAGTTTEDRKRVFSKTEEIEPSASSAVVVSALEKEPNETPGQALEVKPPLIIDGVIERPGDVDCYRFRVEDGQKLAFEIETSERQPPSFNPRIGIFDDAGQEILTNIYKAIGGDGDDWIKYDEPKVIHTFKSGGEYVLQVRDLTTRYGGSDFKYRVLIRLQIPHVGEIRIEADHLNLVAGQAQKVTVISEHEEGYSGEVALNFENLPPGVLAFPAAETESEIPPPLSTLNKEKFRPKSQKTTIMLLASPDAPAGKELGFVELKARPVLEGQLGSPLLVRRIPVIITNPTNGE